MIGAWVLIDGWDQLARLWALIVMVCKFLWALLRLLGSA
jgi:hypothetical protein